MKQKTIFFLFFFCIGKMFSQSVTELKLDDLDARLAKGEDTTFVINFWATWCRPCIAELPYFEAINEQFADKKVKVLLVSVDFLSLKTEKVIPFVEKKGYKSEWFILNEQKENEWINRVSPDWSGAIPATLVVNSARHYRGFYEQDFENADSLQAIFQSLVSP